jgi:hypothetical protein
VHGLNRRVGAVWTWQTHVGLRSGATAWRRSCTTGRRGSHLPLPSHIAVSPAVLAPCHSPHVASYRSVGVRTASVVSRQLFFPVARCSKALSISHVVDVLFSHRCVALVSSTGDWLLSPVDTGQPDSSS